MTTAAPNKGRRVDDTSSKSSHVEIVMYKDVLSLRGHDFFYRYSSKRVNVLKYSSY